MCGLCITGQLSCVGVPSTLRTQQSCSMSFSPGNRGDEFSSSPKIQPTALKHTNTHAETHTLQSSALHHLRCSLIERDIQVRVKYHLKLIQTKPDIEGVDQSGLRVHRVHFDLDSAWSSSYHRSTPSSYFLAPYSSSGALYHLNTNTCTMVTQSIVGLSP